LEVADRPDERRALAQLTFDELARIPGGIWGTHHAIAHRTFRALGPLGVPARVAHDATSDKVYGALRGCTRALGRLAGVAVSRRRPDGGRSISIDPRGGLLIGAIDGLIGDALERERSPLQEPMAVRVRGRAVTLDEPALAGAFPRATPRLVVFVHGLMGTEVTWHWGARDGRESYGARLERELGCIPVYVRYNTGRHVSENGRSLADLLEQLVAAWPTGVEEVALVGHSMGGLVARSACHQAALDESAWTGKVRHVVSLGTPHMGAPLAQGVHYLSAALHALPETRPVASFLRRRSAGIRDLRQGSLVDRDWLDRDPDALKAVACEEVPLLEGATHCFVSATITSRDGDPIGRLLGDLLVLQPSASGRSRSRRIPFEAEYGMHLGRANHIALLNHPAVSDKLCGWLSASRSAGPGCGCVGELPDHVSP